MKQCPETTSLRALIDSLNDKLGLWLSGVKLLGLSLPVLCPCQVAAIAPEEAVGWVIKHQVRAAY